MLVSNVQNINSKKALGSMNPRLGAKKHFAAGRAMVQVIGADNKTIVNTCGIDSYLNYLSMATNIDQVLVLEARNDSAGNLS